jgi:hypothetical protein
MIASKRKNMSANESNKITVKAVGANFLENYGWSLIVLAIATDRMNFFSE